MMPLPLAMIPKLLLSSAMPSRSLSQFSLKSSFGWHQIKAHSLRS